MLKRSLEIRGRLSAVCWPIIDDFVRTFLMLFVLKPAAAILPRQGALAIAHLCGSVMFAIPASGRTVLANMRKAFGMDDAEARRSARENLAQPFYTFVVFHRVLHSREYADDWKIEERNNQDVVRLRESGRAFIIATGHFRREFFYTICMPRFCPGKVAIVPVPMPAPSLRPQNLRLRVQFGQFLKVYRHNHPDRITVDAGGSVRKLLKQLAQPGSQLVMSVDAFWKTTGGSAYTRPFAGMKSRPFSIGSAALSRLAQCPIVACAGYVSTDGTVVLEWGPVIEPPRREDEAADIPTTNALLDFLEKAIGCRPTQYVLYLGEERRWNPGNHVWEDPEEKVLRCREG